MNKLKEINTIDELLERYSVEEILLMIKDESLLFWLDSKFYNYQAQSLRKFLQNEEITDIDCIFFFFELFNVSKKYINEDLLYKLSNKLKKDRKVYSLIGTHVNNIAFNQNDLIKLLHTDATIIYLVNNEFYIPLEKRGITYIGKENAVINLPFRGNIDFKDFDIHLKDVTVFLDHNIDINQDNLENVKILSGTELIKGNEMLFGSLSQGRDEFTTKCDFKRQVKDLLPIQIGNVFLQKDGYDIEKELFEINPSWNIKYIDYIDKFIQGKRLYFRADRIKAKNIFEQQRKFKLNAIFDTDGDNIYISRVFFISDEYGEIEINEKKIIKLTVNESSGFCISGYGIDLIDKE